MKEGARTDLWEIGTKNKRKRTNNAAVFPRALAQRCIGIGTKAGDIVLDPFMGEGTTLWAARENERRASGIDINQGCYEAAMKTLTEKERKVDQSCDQCCDQCS